MDKNSTKECVGAIIEAAVKYGWGEVLNMTLKEVVEQLTETNTTDPIEAVQMFADYMQSIVEAAERAAGWNPNP